MGAQRKKVDFTYRFAHPQQAAAWEPDATRAAARNGFDGRRAGVLDWSADAVNETVFRLDLTAAGAAHAVIGKWSEGADWRADCAAGFCRRTLFAREVRRAEATSAGMQNESHTHTEQEDS